MYGAATLGISNKWVTGQQRLHSGLRRVAFTLASLCLAACVDTLATSDRACPCAGDWVCCDGVCVASVEACCANGLIRDGQCLLANADGCADADLCVSGLCECGNSECSAEARICTAVACDQCEFSVDGLTCAGSLDGPACDDEDVCTEDGVCVEGVCTNGAPAADRTPCDLGECHSGMCTAVVRVWGDTPDSDYPGTAVDTYLAPVALSHQQSPMLFVQTSTELALTNVAAMKWDLSAIDPNATIVAATLELFAVLVVGSTDTSITAHRIINVDPDLLLATGLTYDGVNAWTPVACCDPPLAMGDIGLAEATVTTVQTQDYASWDLTEIVRDWHSGAAPNYGVLLRGDDSLVQTLGFGSTERFVAEERPRLTITFGP